MNSTQKPAILILHPLFLSGEEIKHAGLFSTLRKNYRLVFPDFPAHGSRRHESFVDIDQAIRDLVQTLDREEPETNFAASIGLSLGGRILLELQTRPDSARFGTAILDGVPLAENWTNQRKKSLRLFKIIGAISRTLPALTKKSLRKLYGEEAAQRMFANLRGMEDASLQNIVKACTNPLPPLTADQLASCTFFYGDREDDYKRIAALHKQYPSAKLQVHKGFNHIEFCSKENERYCALIESILTPRKTES